MEFGNHNLIISDVYEYDIVACHYYLLKNIGWDLSSIPFENKIERNIQIGLLQKDNPKLARYLLENTEGIIQYYIEQNNLTSNDIILRVRDGIYTTVLLRDNTSSLNLELRGMISKMIMTLDRKKYMMIKSSGEVSVKGIPNKPIDNSFYDLFRNLNFSNKTSLVRGIENLRQFIFKSKNVKWFVFKSEDSYIVPIIGVGEIKVLKSGLENIDVDEINKKVIWEEYVWPFIQPILIYCE